MNNMCWLKTNSIKRNQFPTLSGTKPKGQPKPSVQPSTVQSSVKQPIDPNSPCGTPLTSAKNEPIPSNPPKSNNRKKSKRNKKMTPLDPHALGFYADLNSRIEPEYD